MVGGEGIMQIMTSKNFFVLLQVRAAICFIILSFVSGIIAALNLQVSIIFALMAVILYLVISIFYIRAYVRSVLVAKIDENLVVKRGVFFSVIQVLPPRLMRYIKISKTPLSGILDVYKVSIYTSSSMVKICGINKKSAKLITDIADSAKVIKNERF